MIAKETLGKALPQIIHDSKKKKNEKIYLPIFLLITASTSSSSTNVTKSTSTTHNQFSEEDILELTKSGFSRDQVSSKAVKSAQAPSEKCHLNMDRDHHPGVWLKKTDNLSLI